MNPFVGDNFELSEKVLFQFATPCLLWLCNMALEKGLGRR